MKSEQWALQVLAEIKARVIINQLMKAENLFCTDNEAAQLWKRLPQPLFHIMANKGWIYIEFYELHKCRTSCNGPLSFFMTKVACHSVKNGHIDGGEDTPLVIATVSSKGGGTGSQVNIHQEMETNILILAVL